MRTEVAMLDAFVTTSPVGLKLRGRGSLEIAEWAEVGRYLGAIGNSALWWIGDWMALGEKTYGSTYSEGQAITGFAYQTLRNLAAVCNAIEVSRRRDNLSFTHHAEVAGLAPWAQDAWLERASVEGLTCAQLRTEIRGRAELPTPGPVFATIRFTAPAERADRWQAAAEAAGVELAEWASNVLDEAAA